MPLIILFLILSSNVSAFTGVDIDGDKFEYKHNMMYSKKPIVMAWVGDILGGHHIHTFIAKLEKKHGNIPSRHALRVHVPSRPSNTVKRNSIGIASSNQLHRDQVRSVKSDKPKSSRRS
jgi:hypothetical protein